MFLFTIILVVVLLIFMFVVDFVLTNVEMFRASFDIVIGVPLFKRWSYTLEGIEFMYIIAGSVLLGALVVALGTWVLDVKRKLKLRNTRKELKRLQQAIQEAKSSLPPEEEAETPKADEAAPSPTPEEITKSFEDTVQQRGFLEETEKSPGEPEEQAGYETVEEQKGETIEQEYTSSETERSLPRETPIEAELVESEHLLEEEEQPGKKKLDEKD